MKLDHTNICFEFLFEIQAFPCDLADELVDCLDADCCVDVRCIESEFCSAAPDPMEILLSKQPPKNTASFFERVKFLVESDSVQSNAVENSFVES